MDQEARAWWFGGRGRDVCGAGTQRAGCRAQHSTNRRPSCTASAADAPPARHRMATSVAQDAAWSSPGAVRADHVLTMLSTISSVIIACTSAVNVRARRAAAQGQRSRLSVPGAPRRAPPEHPSGDDRRTRGMFCFSDRYNGVATRQHPIQLAW
jgi:hypothetical protein